MLQCVKGCVIKTKLIIDRSSCPDLFCKKGVPEKSRKTHRKTPLPESLLNKVSGLQLANLLKRGSSTGNFLWNLQNFKSSYFVEYLRTVASLQRVDYFTTKSFFNRFLGITFEWKVACVKCSLTMKDTTNTSTEIWRNFH